MSRSRRQLAEHIGVNPKWLPEDEQAERVVEWIDDGTCYIVKTYGKTTG